MQVPSSLSLLGILPALACAATLTQITAPFGPNPRNVSFHIYVPDTLPPNPAVLVNPHWCHGTAQAAFQGSQWATLASKHGFIVIYPGSPNAADQCWDVSSKETLTHEGGGDSLGIVSMVRWTLDKYHADSKRVFVTGVSSGGMMTQVLLGSYPDVFAAGAAFAGVPFGCYAPKNNAGQYGYWNAECATGKVTHSAEQWGDLVRAAYPEYNGWRPKVQLFHGTNDEIVSYVNHVEGIKLWADVLGLSETPAQMVQNTPLASWTKSVYGPTGWLEAYSAQGVPHDIKVQENTVMAFFELNCTSNCFHWGKGSPCGGGEPSTTSTTAKSSLTFVTISTKSSSTTPTPSSALVTTSTKSSFTPTSTTSWASSTTSACHATYVPGGQALWAQCGGIGYSGPSACANGACTTYNSWFAQCVPTPACTAR
ncbi:carbohydrate-binding module family 1 protein [Parathielavia appendiculata]|uniref:Carboxylic ester hydrolase n=1 Tax=Parathielavia appendiculata TaxID=2587402 RepID=A0AAN6TVC5_9PEZI|nr:carbohydrate-binding module family 1 protein [Parathielavia appendiculata]